MRQGRSGGFGLIVNEHGRPGGDPDPATSRGLMRPCDLRQISRDRPELTSPPQPPKWTGTVRVRTPPPKSGGGAGTGLARRGSEIASASSAGLPDEPIRRADSTWPDRAMVKATEGGSCAGGAGWVPFVAVQMGRQLALPGRRRDRGGGTRARRRGRRRIRSGGS